VSNAPGKPVSFSRPKVGYFSNRPRMFHGVQSTELRGYQVRSIALVWLSIISRQKNHVADRHNQTLTLRRSTPFIFNPVEDRFKWQPACPCCYF